MKALLLALFLLTAGPVLAHSWYDSTCCSDSDCFHEREGAEVTGEPVRGGYLIKWHGREWVFDERQVRRSQDGKYHICLMQDEDGGDYAARPRCVYVPDAGT